MISRPPGSGQGEKGARGHHGWQASLIRCAEEREGNQIEARSRVVEPGPPRHSLLYNVPGGTAEDVLVPWDVMQ